MIAFLPTADIFASKLQTLVNPVNCVGVMGVGLALGFKQRFPQTMFDAYARQCKSGLLKPGKLHLWKPKPEDGDCKWVLNLPTKDDYRCPSNADWIEESLISLTFHYKHRSITGLAFPKLGCGLGGLPWELVREMMVKYLSGFDIPIEIYGSGP